MIRHDPYSFRSLSATTLLAVSSLFFQPLLSNPTPQEHTDSQRDLAEADRLGDTIERALHEGRYRDAIADADRRLTIQRRLLGERHIEVARTLVSLGTAQWRQARNTEAEASLREALDIFHEHLGASHPEIADCLNMLGLSLMAQGYHDEAEELYVEGLSMARQFEGAQAIVVSCLSDLGAVFQEQRDLVRSEPFRREALALGRELYGPEHPMTARLTFNLAKLIVAMGNQDEGEILHREALALRRKLLGDEHPDVAFSMSLLGEVLMTRGKYEEAESLLREALTIRRAALGDDHPHVAWNVGLLASLHRRRGEYHQALSLSIDMLERWERVLGRAHLNVMRGLTGVGDLYRYLGDYDKEKQYYLEALSVLHQLPAEGNHGERVFLPLGRMAWRSGDLEQAEKFFLDAADVFERDRLSWLGLERRARYGSGYTPYLELAAVRLVRGKTEEAWPAAERYFGRTLFDLLAVYGERPLTDKEANREHVLGTELMNLEQRYATLRAQPESKDESELSDEIKTVRERLLEAQREWAQFREELRQKYPVAEGEVFSLARIQESLDTNTAIVGWLDHEPYTGDRLSWVFVIRKNGPVRWTPLSRSNYEGMHEVPPQTFRDALVTAAWWPFPVTVVDKIHRMAASVYRQRLAPIAEDLENVAKLIVIPSGVMQGVPIEALMDNSGTLVGDRYTVSYTSSGTVHAWLRERASPSATFTGSALVVGDPLVTAFVDGELAPHSMLPMSAREVNRVAELIPGAVTLSGKGASEAALVRLAGSLGEFETIHIATHATIDPKRPERSYLALSQHDLPDPLESALSGERMYDGLLTVQEIVREWDLDADLVTLSACQTALGREAGGEGIVGFAHAFLRVGARSVVVSLWHVEDVATALLMERFYENLTGNYVGERLGVSGESMPKALALREAKLWLREYVDDSGRAPFRHPAYWSAFILLGDPG